jgi:tRNA(fMet)-specific endonuclease VapC
MRYMLDTNICSYILKNRPLEVKHRFEQAAPETVCVSVIVVSELYYGAARHPNGMVIRREIDDFINRLEIVPWDLQAADQYGALRATLERAGTPLGAMDMLIAAHAKSREMILVTNNRREFDRVQGLSTENWIVA